MAKAGTQEKSFHSLMAHQRQDRSKKTIFSRKHTMNHTTLDFIESDSLIASSALNLEPRTAEPAIPSSSFCCLLLFCGETALALHLASSANTSVPFSGVLGWV